jgi:hypothetical protein
VERRSGEVEGGAELVDEELPIRFDQKVGVIDEKDEFGGSRVHLGEIVDTKPFPNNHRGVALLEAKSDEFVENACRKTDSPILIDLLYEREDLPYISSVLSRHKKRWTIC